MTVRDILRFPVFEGAEVVAGHRGLDRCVTGVNVMEVPDVARWLHGGELLLTAAYALSREPSLCHTLVRSLADRNVAALVIKRSPYLSNIPQVMLAQAEEEGLPIVVIPSHIPYFQIMDAILANVYSHQLYLLKRSNDIHRKFTADALRDAKPFTVAQTLASLCGHDVFLEDRVEGILHYVGRLGQRSLPLLAMPEEVARAFGDYFAIRETLTGNEPAGHVAVGQERRAIVGWLEGGGRQLGLLMMVDHGRGLVDMDQVAFGHAVVLASFALLQERAVKEAVDRKDAELVDSLIGLGAPPDGAVEARLRQRLGPFAVLLVVRLSAKAESDLGRVVAQFEHFLSVRNWKWLVSARESNPVYLVAVADIGEAVEEVLARSLRPMPGTYVGVSSSRAGLAHLPVAFREAGVALKTAELFGRHSPVFYSRLGTDRLLAELADSPVLKDMVSSSLGPLLAFTDRDRELLATLRAFLDSGGNKERAARRLFIHRTTLLYRLKRLAKLLGKDLEDPIVRLDLQIAIRAMDLLGELWSKDAT